MDHVQMVHGDICDLNFQTLSLMETSKPQRGIEQSPLNEKDERNHLTRTMVSTHIRTYTHYTRSVYDCTYERGIVCIPYYNYTLRNNNNNYYY